MFTTDALAAALSGRYTLDRLVGEGGMAKVFLARDLRHNRQVALKVLRPDLGAVVGVDRFQAEIEVTANLQHPNLLPLFDSGIAGDLLYYVMPYVEGESLRARLEREKQLPVDEAVRLSSAIASALDYAHRKGVIHRDLKPENILLHEGQPLVADFGIALAISNAGGARITQTGLSLGTPQYMSPEQATGDRAIDARTDIYALGALTYEMLTGEPPHTGSTAQAIIARVLTETPRSIRTTRPMVSDAIEATVARALAKIPADRFATAKDFGDALGGRWSGPTPSTFTAATTAPSSGRQRMLVGMVSALLVLLAAGAWYTWRERTDAVAQLPAPVVRFTFPTPDRESLQLAVAPDGHAVVFIASQSRGRVLMMRQLGSLALDTLRGTDNAFGPSWSPNSQDIAVLSDGKLKRVHLADRSVRVLADVPGGVGGTTSTTWLSDSTIVISASGTLYSVPASGGAPTAISVTPEGRWRGPTAMNDGRHFLAVHLGKSGTSDADSLALYVLSIDGVTSVRVSAVDARAMFVAPDFVMMSRDQTLFVQRLNMKTFTLEGEAVRLADTVAVNGTTAALGISASSNGVLVFSGGTSAGFRQLAWYGRAGQRLGYVGDSARIAELSLSPDNRWILTSVREGPSREIRLTDVARNVTSMFSRTSPTASVWTPDSKAVVYNGLGSVDVYRMQLGAGKDSLILKGRNVRQWPQQVLSDGSMFLLVQDSLFLLPAGAGATPRLVVSIKGINEIHLSPDGKQLAYGTNESGTWQVYVARYPELDDRRQVSPSGGVQPRWSADSRELFYLDLKGRVMSATRSKTNPKELEAPVALFASPDPLPAPTFDEWDAANDGKRFLFAEPLGKNDPAWSTLTVVLNWPALIKQPALR
jgi:eukaryotic-like serine/threonine-protein kinase